MSDENDKKKSTQKSEWDFKIDDSQISQEDKKNPPRISSIQRSPKLSLEKNQINNAKTREEHFKELEAKKLLDEDIIEQPAFINRIAAGIIDLIFFGFLLFTAKYLSPFSQWICSLPMSRYKFHWILRPDQLFHLFSLLNFSVLIMFFIIFPTLFYNCSLGKKLFKLRIRGRDRYSLSFEQVIMRELILKPISIFLIVGILLPFFNKENKALHDYLAKTIVVKN